jgi:hypothetical protein
MQRKKKNKNNPGFLITILGKNEKKDKILNVKE